MNFNRSLSRFKRETEMRRNLNKAENVIFVKLNVKTFNSFFFLV